MCGYYDNIAQAQGLGPTVGIYSKKIKHRLKNRQQGQGSVLKDIVTVFLTNHTIEGSSLFLYEYQKPIYGFFPLSSSFHFTIKKKKKTQYHVSFGR